MIISALCKFSAAGFICAVVWLLGIGDELY